MKLTPVQRSLLAKKFLAEMARRGAKDPEDQMVQYHLALLLDEKGHPTIKLTDEEMKEGGG